MDAHCLVKERKGEVGLVWFRVGDLRQTDNPALDAALAEGPVVPVFAWSPAEEGKWVPGAASRWWLPHSLAELAKSLEQRGSQLIIRSGSSTSNVLGRLVAETGATRVYFRRFVPELCRLPAPYIQAPWTAPPMVLADAGVTLGREYPWPIVDHPTARARALAAFRTPRMVEGRNG